MERDGVKGEDRTIQLKSPIGHGYEFVTVIGQLVDRYIDTVRSTTPEYMLYQGHSIRGVLRERLFTAAIYNQRLRNLFNEHWESTDLGKDAMEVYYKIAFGEYFFDGTKLTGSSLPSEKDSETLEQYKEILSPYRKSIVYYAYNQRFLELVLPLLSKLDGTVVVLTMADILEPANWPENVQLIEFPVLKSIMEYKNPFLGTVFPILYHTFNNLAFLTKFLEPRSIILPEGANVIEYKMLAVLGKVHGVPTICLQHGWPGLLHLGFHDMEYDHYLSWGKISAKLLETVSPAPIYNCSGYPNEIPNIKLSKKKAISFFFQGPYYVSDEGVIRKMLDFALYCAESFPSLEIWIREHPSCKLNPTPKVLEKIRSIENIRFASRKEYPLEEVLANSIVNVSVFSSSLVESLLYGCIPFVLNLTSMPCFTPDLDAQGLGIEVRTMGEAKKRIRSLLKEQAQIRAFQKRISKASPDFFSATGKVAMQKIVNYIETVSNKKA